MRRHADAERHLVEALAATSDTWITQNRAVLEATLQQARAAQGISVIEVSSNVASAEVFINGTRMGTAGASVRTSQGTVSFEVRAPGHATASRTVTLGPGQTHRETVNLTAEASATPTAPVARAAGAPVAVEPAARVLPPPRQTGGGTARTLAWIGAAGAGALLLTGGIVLGVREGQVSTARDAACLENEGTVYGGGDCPSLYRSTNTLQAVGVATLVAGGLLAAASSVLFLVSPTRSRESTAGLRLRCGSGPGQLGVACSGAF